MYIQTHKNRVRAPLHHKSMAINRTPFPERMQTARHAIKYAAKSPEHFETSEADRRRATGLHQLQPIPPPSMVTSVCVQPASAAARQLENICKTAYDIALCARSSLRCRGALQRTPFGVRRCVRFYRDRAICVPRRTCVRIRRTRSCTQMQRPLVIKVWRARAEAARDANDKRERARDRIDAVRIRDRVSGSNAMQILCEAGFSCVPQR